GSGAVSNPENTRFVSAVAAGNPRAPQVDPVSLRDPTIIVKSGISAGALLPLVGEKTEWSIGSSADRDLVIAESGVSTNHALISREGSKWKLIDQMSLNGTFVNDSSTVVRYIGSGDKLRFGPVECQFSVPAGYRGPRTSRKTGKNNLGFWKIAIPVAIILILGSAYYAYTSGILTSFGLPSISDIRTLWE
ncbi:FHA domain-containing protein, partial [bacterium]|nr:FHA domain-containing protein [bacterium]